MTLQCEPVELSTELLLTSRPNPGFYGDEK